MKAPLLCAVAAALACALAPARACEAVRGQSYRVGVERLQYFPLHTVDHKGAYGGFARELLDAFARQHGYVFEYVPLPINRLYAQFLSEQQLDFKYPDNPRWREDLRDGMQLWYSDIVVSTEEGALVLPQRRGMALAELHSLGTVLGFTPWPYQAAIEQQAVKVSTGKSAESLMRLAMAGHLDAVYVNVDVARHLLADELKAPGALVFDNGLPHARSDFRLSTLRCKEVVEQFNRFLQREQGLLQGLRSRYRIGAGEARQP